jgi:hypothetical protein
MIRAAVFMYGSSMLLLLHTTTRFSFSSHTYLELE